MKRYWLFCLVLLGGLTFANALFAIEVGGVGAYPAKNVVNQVSDRSWFQYTILPGSSIEDKLTVVNNTDQPTALTLYAADGTKSSDGGFAVEQKVETTDEVGKWVLLSEQEVVVPPLSSLDVPFTLYIPAEQQLQPGEYTGGIMLAATDNGESTADGISLSTRVGVRIYITVPGNIEEAVSFQPTTIQQLENNPSFIDVTTNLQNSGGVSEDVTVISTVDFVSPWPNWLSRGQKLPYVTTRQIEVLRDSVLPVHESVAKPWFGVLKINQHLSYRTASGDVRFDDIETNYTVWPAWYALLLLLVGLFVLGLLVVYGVYTAMKRKTK